MMVGYTLFNKRNFKKIVYSIKYNGISATFTKIKNKLNQPDIKELLSSKNKYANQVLYTPFQNNCSFNDYTIDIIIPVYNAYDYLVTCIESVLRHTTVSYNLFILNDCSTDERIRPYLTNLKSKKLKYLKQLTVIENAQNMGFVKTVNKGIALSKSDLVILNTDTEVVSRWMQRLIVPMMNDSAIASVTPFSNSATICSFPVFCENNDLYNENTLLEIDQAFQEANFTEPIELPTGIGFCMLMSRKCIDEIGIFDEENFDKGYGEENDWCRRAVKAGYKNVLTPNLFIYHKHGVSFDTKQNYKREVLRQKNLAILNTLHPDYQTIIQDFVTRDIIMPIRMFVKWSLDIKKSTKTYFFINHSLGGGTQEYQNEYIKKLPSGSVSFSFILQIDGKTVVLTNDNTDERLCFDIRFLDSKMFSRLVTLLNIDIVYINSLVTYPLVEIIEWIKVCKKPYVFFIHDFHAVCPSLNLINSNRQYCFAEKNIAVCNQCLPHNEFANIYDGNITISYWRKLYAALLVGAQKVVAPSENAARIINKYYPHIDIEIVPHCVDYIIEKTFQNSFTTEKILNIAFVGAISVIKGEDIIYALADKIRTEFLPIRIKIIGITNRHGNSYKSKDGILEITGKYKKEELPALLGKHHIAIVGILSVWPETFSYTTSEVRLAGYPVMCFDIGAPAERVNNKNLVIKEISVDAVLDKLKEILKHRSMLRHTSIDFIEVKNFEHNM